MNKVLRMAIPLALLAVTPLQAQDIALGFKGGINIAEQNLSAGGVSLNFENRTGFVGGAFATIGLGTTLFLQPEALYSSKGFKIDVSDIIDGDAEASVKLDYLEIPVLIGARFDIADSPLRPSIYAGPSVGFKLSCNASGSVEGVTETEDCSDGYESVDFGLDFGASLALELSSFDLIFDGRYALGLTNTAKDATGDESLKNRAWQFMVGFGFPLM
jgi:hypothetical protein